MSIYFPDDEGAWTINIDWAVFIASSMYFFLAGISLGDCPALELKSLLKTLKIDTSKVAPSSGNDGDSETRIFPDVDLPAIAARKSLAPSKVAKGNLLRLRQNLFERQKAADAQESQSEDDAEVSPCEEDQDAAGEEEAEADGAADPHAAAAAAEDDSKAAEEESDVNDEMMVTPDVQMFFGSHFLASSMENGDEAGTDEGDGDKDEAEEAASGEEEAPNGGASFLEQTMARHKEMMMRNGGGMDMGGGPEDGALRNMAAAYGGFLSSDQVTTTG